MVNILNWTVTFCFLWRCCSICSEDVVDGSFIVPRTWSTVFCVFSEMTRFRTVRWSRIGMLPMLSYRCTPPQCFRQILKSSSNVNSLSVGTPERLIRLFLTRGGPGRSSGVGRLNSEESAVMVINPHEKLSLLEPGLTIFKLENF